MSSSDPINRPNTIVVLISAVFILQAHEVRAVEWQVDAQTQARDLLSGTVHGRARTIDRSTAIAAEGRRPPALDPQGQARRLILGNSDFGAADSSVAFGSKTKVTPAATARRERRGSDPQELAQRMILHGGA
jgi:hypothetical protein